MKYFLPKRSLRKRPLLPFGRGATRPAHRLLGLLPWEYGRSPGGEARREGGARPATGQEDWAQVQFTHKQSHPLSQSRKIPGTRRGHPGNRQNLEHWEGCFISQFENCWGTVGAWDTNQSLSTSLRFSGDVKS